MTDLRKTDDGQFYLRTFRKKSALDPSLPGGSGAVPLKTVSLNRRDVNLSTDSMLQDFAFLYESALAVLRRLYRAEDAPHEIQRDSSQISAEWWPGLANCLETLIFSMLELHALHIQMLSPDINVGARVYTGAEDGARKTREVINELRGAIKESWKAHARKRWEANPHMGSTEVARGIVKNCDTRKLLSGGGEKRYSFHSIRNFVIKYRTECNLTA